MPDRYDKWGKQLNDHPYLRITGWAVAGVLIVLLCVGLVGLISTGSVFFQGAAAKKTVGARTDIKVFTPENKIAQISFFHDTCQQANAQLRIVQHNEARLKADRQAAEFAKDPVRQQQAVEALGQDQQDITGAQDALENTVANYNSRSAQSTANVFKGTGLPDRINLPNPLPSQGYTINCG